MVLPASDCAFEPLLQFLGTGLLPCVDGKRKGSESFPGGSRGTFWESTEVAAPRVFQRWTPAALIGGPLPGSRAPHAPSTRVPPSRPPKSLDRLYSSWSNGHFLLSPQPQGLRRSSEEPQDWSRRAARQTEVTWAEGGGARAGGGA